MACICIYILQAALHLSLFVAKYTSHKQNENSIHNEMCNKKEHLTCKPKALSHELVCIVVL